MITRLLAGLALFSVAMAASAQTNQNFSVTTTFTPTCTASGTAADLSFGAYTAFGSAATSAPTTTVSFTCSRGFPLSKVSFDTSGDVATSSAAGATPSAGGVIAGLRYTLSTAAGSRTSGTAATASAAGTADSVSFLITGAMADGQAGCTGTGTTGDRCSASQTRTLTIAF